MPLAAFALARRIPSGQAPRLLGLLALGASQGAIGGELLYCTRSVALPATLSLSPASSSLCVSGWWMVKSGLEHERFGELDRPRVSPYRLATHVRGARHPALCSAWHAHHAPPAACPCRASLAPPPLPLPLPPHPQLGMAFTLYSGLVWVGLDLWRAGAPPAPVTAAAKAAAAQLRGPAAALALVVAATAASGAFVAGNDAGHAFNDWPLFAGRAVPEGIWEEVRGGGDWPAGVQLLHAIPCASPPPFPGARPA